MAEEQKIQPKLMPVNTEGIDTSAFDVLLSPGSSPSLENVDLHPLGTVSKRAGFSELCDVDGDPNHPYRDEIPGFYPAILVGDPCDGIVHLQKSPATKGMLYAIKGGAIFRRDLDGSKEWIGVGPTMLTAPATLTPGAVYSHAIGNYATPGTNYGPVAFVANGVDVPVVLMGLDPASSETVMTRGQYPDGVDTLAGGMPGIPAGGTYTGGSETRDWTTDPPSFFSISNQAQTIRMWAGGFASRPDEMDYSELDAPMNFLRSDTTNVAINPYLDGGAVRILPGDGDSVTGFVELYGYKIAFKKLRCALYTGDPGYDWTRQAIFPFGAVSQNSIIKFGNDVAFWSEDGPHTIATVQAYGDLKHANIGSKITDIIGRITPNYKHLIHGRHDVANGRLIWSLPVDGAAYCNLSVVWYYDKPQRWTVFTGALSECVGAALGRADAESRQVVYGAMHDGRIAILQEGTTDGFLNGDKNVPAPISCFIDLPWSPITIYGFRKRMLNLDLLITDTIIEFPMVKVGFDYSPEWIDVESVAKSIGGEPSLWDYSKWDDTFICDQTASAMIQYHLDGTGYLVRFRFFCNNANPWRLSAYAIYADTEGTR